MERGAGPGVRYGSLARPALPCPALPCPALPRPMKSQLFYLIKTWSKLGRVTGQCLPAVNDEDSTSLVSEGKKLPQRNARTSYRGVVDN